MFDEVCSELRDLFHDAIVDLITEEDADELAPKFSEIADDCNIFYTDDGLAVVCGEVTYGISIQKL